MVHCNQMYWLSFLYSGGDRKQVSQCQRPQTCPANKSCLPDVQVVSAYRFSCGHTGAGIWQTFIGCDTVACVHSRMFLLLLLCTVQIFISKYLQILFFINFTIKTFILNTQRDVLKCMKKTFRRHCVDVTLLSEYFMYNDNHTIVVNIKTYTI